MGGIRRYKKKILTPGHPYDKDRIERELPLVGEYGLRNKKELWKARTLLSKARQQARALLALTPEIREQRATELLSRLTRFGMLPQGGDLDSVLALNVKTVLNRRLQTVVFRKGLATSPYQARQFITHRHIALNSAVVTAPGMLVKIDEEEHIAYAPSSPLVKQDHPSRPQAPPTQVEEPPEKKESPKGREKPKPKVKPPAKPEVKPPAKPEVKPPAKPEVKPPAKPEVKPKAEIKEVPKAAPKAAPKEKPPVKKPAEKKPIEPKSDISLIKGIGVKTAMLLKENGFNTVDKIAKATVEDLSKVPGIGPATAEAMNKEAKNLLAKSKGEAK